MALYVYETTDPEKPVQRFELRQSMRDEPLTAHPETGEPIRRVISGGFGYMARGNGARKNNFAPSSGHCCGGGCACC